MNSVVKTRFQREIFTVYEVSYTAEMVMLRLDMRCSTVNGSKHCSFLQLKQNVKNLVKITNNFK